MKRKSEKGDKEPKKKKARVEHTIDCIVNARDTYTNEVETEVNIFSTTNIFVMERVYYHLELATRVSPSMPGVPVVILGGLTISRCHWDLNQYAMWHGIDPKTNELLIAYMESTIELLNEIIKHDNQASWRFDNVVEPSASTGKILLVSCDRAISNE
jgi:hypothetical protein